ncbi:hypothetical protein D3C72_2148860 [compost metagenome]
MGPEDVLFRKILSHREERRDWYDALSMMTRPQAGFDWEYFLTLVGEQYARRTLSFLFYAQTEIREDIAPPQVVAELLDRLQPELPREATLGPALFAPAESQTRVD